MARHWVEIELQPVTVATTKGNRGAESHARSKFKFSHLLVISSQAALSKSKSSLYLLVDDVIFGRVSGVNDTLLLTDNEPKCLLV